MSLWNIYGLLKMSVSLLLDDSITAILRIYKYVAARIRRQRAYNAIHG